LEVNGGFETGTFAGWTTETTGSGAWVISDGTFDPASPDIPLPVFEGSFCAVTDQTGPGVRTLRQDVFVPFGSEAVTLRWADRIRNFGGAFSSNQRFRVEIRTTNNTVLAQAYSTQPGDPLLNDWVQRSFDLSPYRGQSIRVAFVEQDNSGYFNVHLDQV